LDYVEAKSDEMIDKYGEFLDQARGGIFTRKSREKLIGKVRIYGKEASRNNFWYDRRNDIKSAFKDMTIFFQVAGKNNVDQVLEDVDFDEFLHALLEGDKKHLLDDSNPKKSFIAQKLVAHGLLFLSNNLPHKITKSHQRTIEEALDLSKYLVSEFLDSPPYGEDGSYFGEWRKKERSE